MAFSMSDCDRFKDVVESIIQKYNTTSGICIEALLPELYKHVSMESSDYVTERTELTMDHSTGAIATQFDYNMIMFSILSISWAIRMRKTKSVEGQCWKHTNCNATRQFHKEIYNLWIETIENLLNILNSDPNMKMS